MSNQDKKTYVCNAITQALIRLLKTRPLSAITIQEITDAAQVSRNSFYRNFDTKEDILRRKIKSVLQQWQTLSSQASNVEPFHFYGLLFAAIEQNRDFFLVLRDANLLYLLQDEFFHLLGPSTDDSDEAAYAKAYVAYSTYGFLETWIRRGMNKSAAQMEEMLRGSSN